MLGLICFPCVLSLFLGMCGFRYAFIPVLTLPAWQAIAARIMKDRLPDQSGKSCVLRYMRGTVTSLALTDADTSYISGVSKSRLEFFTDGVVAISATLIVLDVQVGGGSYVFGRVILCY